MVVIDTLKSPYIYRMFNGFCKRSYIGPQFSMHSMKRITSTCLEVAVGSLDTKSGLSLCLLS